MSIFSLFRPIIRGFARWPLRYSLSCLLLFSALLIALLDYWFEIGVRTARVQDRAERLDLQIVRHFSHELAEQPRDTTGVELRELFASWIDEDPSVRVSLLNAQGVELFNAGRTSHLPPGRLQSISRTAYLPPADGAALLSQVRWLALERDLGAERSQIESDEIHHLGWRLLLLTVLTGFTWLLLDQLIKQRLDELLRATKEVRGGRLTGRLPVIGRDEIAELGHATNRTLQVLEDDQRTSELHARELTARNAELNSLRQAIDAHAIVSVTDLAGHIIFANEKFCEISGYSAEELLGQNHRILNSRTHPPAMFVGLWQCITSGRAWHGVLQNRTKHGKPYWVQSSILPILDEHGHPSRFISIRTDVTTQERMRAGLEVIADAGHKGEVYDDIARGLALSLDTRWCGIGVFTEGGARIELLSLNEDGKPRDLFGYPVAETPCEGTVALGGDDIFVVEGEMFAAYASRPVVPSLNLVSYRGKCLRDATGQPMGILFVGDDKPASGNAHERAVMNTAARRAQTELVLAADVRALREQQRKMELVLKAGNLRTWEWDIERSPTQRVRPESTAPERREASTLNCADPLGMLEPIDQARYHVAMEDHLAGRSAVFEIEANTLIEGERRAFLHRGQVVDRADDGRPVRMLGVLIDVTEQRRAEAELSMERARLALAVEGAALGTWDWEVETGVVRMNARWSTMLGYEPEEISPSLDYWLALAHPDDQELIKKSVAEHLEGRSEIYLTEHRLRTKDGQWRWVLDSGRITRRAPDGRPLGMSGIHLDITSRKHGEAALRDREQKLKMAAQAGHIGFWDWRLDTDALDLSEAFFDFVTTDGTALTRGTDYVRMTHPDDHESVRHAIVAHLKGETELLDTEARLVTPRQGTLHILSRGQVIERDSTGRALRMIGVHVDVTQQRAAELELHKRSRDLAFIVEAANIGVWDWDLSSGHVAVNAQFNTMLGYVAEPVVAAAWLASLIHPEDMPRAQLTLREHFDGHQEVCAAEIRHLAANGEWFWVYSCGQVVARDADGRATRMVGIHVDINARKQADAGRERLERQLQQAQKMEAIGQLTGGIAHDFNNLLASVVGYTSLARDRFSDVGGRKLAEYLDAVLAASERARELVAKMLAYCRDTPREDLQAIDPEPVIREAVQMLAAVIPSTIDLSFANQATGTPILVDATELSQVIINLAVNARDAMGAHGRLTITLSDVREVQGICASCREQIAGPFVEVALTDTGEGIRPEHLSRIFDPFFTTKEVGKGSGLGLSVVHGILHRGRGHVLVESGVGQGTRIRLLFRAANHRAAPRAIAERSIDAIPIGTWLLVVDDEPALTRYLDEFLSLHGYRVDTAGNGEEALVKVRAHPARYAGILTDQTMPRMTGLELARALIDDGHEIPIVLCSGYGDALDDVNCSELGIRAVLRKPATPERLLNAVAAAIDGALPTPPQRALAGR